MIVDKRTYTLKPGTAPQYMEIYEKYGLEIQSRILGNMYGWFVPELGELNQIIHMWAYRDLADRTARRAALAKDPGWAEFVTRLRQAQIVVTQENQILTPAPWSPHQTLQST